MAAPISDEFKKNRVDELFRRLVNGVQEYAIFRLDPQDIIENWNPGAQRIKQYKASEIIGQSFSRFYPLEDLAAGKPARELLLPKQIKWESPHECMHWPPRIDLSYASLESATKSGALQLGCGVEFEHLTPEASRKIASLLVQSKPKSYIPKAPNLSTETLANK